MTGKKKYNIALIGAGRMGGRWADIVSESRASLALVLDSNRASAKRAAKAHGTCFSAQLDDACADDIDAVVIAVPHAFLFPLAKKALLAGKHVLVEKPGAKTAKEMRELVHIAKQKKRVLTVGFNYRFFDSIRQAKKIADEGTIGEIISVRIVHGHPGRRGYEKEWRMNKKLSGGGVLMDQGLHLIDLARWFLTGRISKAAGFVSNLAWKSEVEDAAALLLQTTTGQVASLSVGISEWKPVFSLYLVGEKGYIAINGLGRKYGDGTRLTLGRYDRKTEELKERIIPCNQDADEALRLEFAEFILSMERRPPATNARDALNVLEIVEAIYAKNS